MVIIWLVLVTNDIFYVHEVIWCLLTFLRLRLMLHIPFGVFVHVCVALDRVFFDEEFDALIEGCGDRRRLLPEEYLHRIVGS